jgi:four helix bundle protein
VDRIIIKKLKKAKSKNSMTYKQFEDIPVWQNTLKFINKIYQVALKSFRNDFVLTDQLKKATYSILLNISEGFERRSNKEFANFINIAKGSAGEVRAILHIAKDRDYLSEKEFSELFEDIQEISKQLSKFREYLIKPRK